jgi:hypothetical protein
MRPAWPAHDVWHSVHAPEAVTALQSGAVVHRLAIIEATRCSNFSGPRMSMEWMTHRTRRGNRGLTKRAGHRQGPHSGQQQPGGAPTTPWEEGEGEAWTNLEENVRGCEAHRGGKWQRSSLWICDEGRWNSDVRWWTQGRGIDKVTDGPFYSGVAVEKGRGAQLLVAHGGWVEVQCHIPKFPFWNVKHFS